ncbi:hypothetical protein [Streptomyces sp. CC224B]|uniref:hypothetical protein n=1 Tax=Streptomyces sp. CC224B TaxID=3044571 RepID=UPI0024A7C434|nr:hypothetical protein [Streptomyces sp. CC224B]
MSKGHDSGGRVRSASSVRAMDGPQMPEPLRRAMHQLVSEAVQNCQEVVLRHTEPNQAHTWKRLQQPATRDR